MSAGVFTLTEANEKAVENTWESADNVWIFPDGGGSEFKFIDGTVTPAPAATPDGPTYIKVNIGGNYAFTTGTSPGVFPLPKRVRGIYATAEFIFLAVKDRSKRNSQALFSVPYFVHFCCVYSLTANQTAHATAQ